MMKPLEVNPADALHGLTMTVTVRRSRWFDLRLRTGILVIRFGTWLMGVGQFKVAEE